MVELNTITFPVPAGIHLRHDPQDLPAGALADCLNCDINQPYGISRPRQGSRILPNETSNPNGGHPVNPLGNLEFKFTARVLRLIPDPVNRKLYAIVRTRAGYAKIYSADLTQTAPGFGNPSTEFALDSERIPGALLHDQHIIIATGVATDYGTIIYDGTSCTANDAITDPVVPLDPTVSTASAGTLTAITAYIYRYCYYSSATKSRSALSKVVSTGAFTNKKPAVTMKGTAPATVGVWDKVELYRTTDGGSKYRFLARVDNIPNGANIVYNDETLDDKLSYKLAPAHSGRVPSCRYCILANGRTFFAFRTQPPIDPNVVYYSEPDAPLNVDPVFNALQVKPDDGGQITGMFALWNRVFVVKDNGAVYELSDNNPLSPFRVQPLVNAGGHGCVSHATITVVGGVAFWLSRKGVVMFNGESVAPVAFQVEPAFVETQLSTRAIAGSLPDTTGSEGYFTFTFTNNDVVTEKFQFAVKMFAVEPVDPQNDAGDVELDTLNNPEQFRANGTVLTPGGIELAPGQQVQIRVYPTGLEHGSQWRIYKQASDDTGVDWFSGGEETAWVFDTVWSFQTVIPGGMDLAWGIGDRFFAFDNPATEELWTFVASRHAADIDSAWILDYRNLAQGTAVWRRYSMHATAGTMVTGIDMSATQKNIEAPIVGDANGLVWMEKWPGLIDRLVHRTTIAELTQAQRNGDPPTTVQPSLDYIGPYVTEEADITGATFWRLHRGNPFNKTIQAWPVNGADGVVGLIGMTVAVKDAEWNTYTGIITQNGASTLDIYVWLEGRTPPLNQAVSFSIGGIDAHIDYFPNPFGDAGVIKRVRQLIIRGQGPTVEIDIEVRMGNQSEEINWGSVSRQFVQRKRIQIGGNEVRAPLTGRFRFAGFRFGTHQFGVDWRMSSCGFALQATEARK